MKKNLRIPLIIVGVVLVSLVCVGITYALRGTISHLTSRPAVTPADTLIFLVPGDFTPTSENAFTPIVANQSPTMTGTGGTTETPQTSGTPGTPTTTSGSSTLAAASATAAAATATAAAGSQSQAQTCANTLYPLRSGDQWTYQVSVYGKVYKVNMAVPSTSGQQAMVSLNNLSSGIGSQAGITCSNAAIQNFAWGAAAEILNQVSLNGLSVQYVSGVLIPSQATLANNNWKYSWTGDYSVTGQATVTYKGKSYTVVTNHSPMHLACHTAGSGSGAFEAIQVKAGSFTTALKVLCSVSLQATIKVGGLSYTGTVTGNTTHWLVPNVGLVKLRVDSATLSYLIFTLPLTVNSNVELTNYQVAP
ncbi:MAG TPA: hypothetical protein VMC09_11165 [Anaerolineales bacterium]|nr:hypothetical protein [Anaerolineales bacterium]